MKYEFKLMDIEDYVSGHATKTALYPHMNQSVLSLFFSMDAHYASDHLVSVVYSDTMPEGYPLFGKYVGGDDEKWTLFLEDMMQVTDLPFTSEEMAKIVETFARTTPFDIEITPNRCRSPSSIHSDKAFWAKEHLVHVPTYGTDHTSKQRNEIKKAHKAFNPNGADLNCYEIRADSPVGEKEPLSIIEQQMWYWFSRKGVRAFDPTYSIRIWMWSIACAQAGFGRIFALHSSPEHIIQGQPRWRTAVAFTRVSPVLHVFSAYAQSNFLPHKSPGAGVTTLDAAVRFLQDEHRKDQSRVDPGRLIRRIALGVASDAFSDMKYMGYKKHVANDYEEYAAFCSAHDTNERHPPMYDTTNREWVIEDEE